MVFAQTKVKDYNYTTKTKLYKKLLKQYPDSSMLYMHRAYFYIEYDEYKKGMADAKKALKLDPNNAWAHYYVARYYNEYKPDSAKAHKAMARAIETSKKDKSDNHPKIKNLYRWKAGWYRKAGDHENAYQTLRDALEYDREDYYLHYVMAEHCLYYLEKPKLALHYVNKSIQKKPRRLKAWKNYQPHALKADVYKELKEFDKAHKAIDSFVRKKWKYQAYAYIDKGDIYKKRGDYEMARKYYRAAKVIDPKIEINRKLARVEAAELNHDKYLYYIKKYLEGRKMDQYYYSQLAAAHAGIKDYKKADYYYNRAFQVGEPDAHLYNAYAYFLSRTGGSLEKADSLIKIGLSFGRNAMYEDTYCFIKSRMGDYDEALKFYETIPNMKKYTYTIEDNPYFKDYKYLKYRDFPTKIDTSWDDGWMQVTLLGDSLYTFYIMNPTDEDIPACSYFNYEWTFKKLRIEGDEWTSHGTQKKQDVDSLAMFPGGDEKLYAYFKQHNMNPKNLPLEKGKINAVYVRFEVNEDGKIVKPTIIRGLEYSIDKAVLERIQNMPNWIPAKKNGKAVATEETIYVPVLGR